MAACAEMVMSDRDGRVVNHMDDETKAVHARLEEWARCVKSGELRAWPSITLLGRVIEQGVNGAGQVGRAPVAMPDHVAHVDAAVARLGDIDRRAIRLYYLEWSSPRILARRMSMRERQFRNVIQRARWRISGFLSALDGGR